jgi:ribonuclease-3
MDCELECPYTEGEIEAIQDGLLGMRFKTEEGRRELRKAITIGLYETGEYFGDAILQQLATTWQMKHSKCMTPGSLTKERTALVDKSACIAYMKRSGVDEVLLKHCHVGGSGIDSILADIFEAMVYALYVDFGSIAGMADLFSYFEKKFSPVIEELIAKPDENYVDGLQRWSQALFQNIPKYTYVQNEGSAPGFICTVSLPCGESFSGESCGNIQRARQSAAKMALDRHCSKILHCPKVSTPSAPPTSSSSTPDGEPTSKKDPVSSLYSFCARTGRKPPKFIFVDQEENKGGRANEKKFFC